MVAAIDLLPPMFSAHAYKDFPVLTAMILVPLVGAIVAMVMPKRRPEYARIGVRVVDDHPRHGRVLIVELQQAHARFPVC